MSVVLGVSHASPKNASTVSSPREKKKTTGLDDDLNAPATFGGRIPRNPLVLQLGRKHIIKGFTHIKGYNQWIYIYIPVGGIPTPLKNMNVSWDDYSQYMESHKSHVPNHQSVNDHLMNLETQGLHPSLVRHPFLSDVDRQGHPDEVPGWCIEMRLHDVSCILASVFCWSHSKPLIIFLDSQFSILGGFLKNG